MISHDLLNDLPPAPLPPNIAQHWLRVQSLALLFIASVCLDKFLKLSVSQFSFIRSVDYKRIKLNKLVKC